MDMFEYSGKRTADANAPLADRMRPRTLDEFVGQEHIVGKGRLLRRAIMIDQLSSVIFFGPPGTGKTTLAEIIANTTKAEFITINAVLAGKKEIRDAIETAKRVLNEYTRKTILFVDEVHRFNKSQQDALLPHVEKGILVLIGATTENPYFEVNKALVSRSMVFQLQSMGAQDLKQIARNAIADRERGLGNKSIQIDEDALSHLAEASNGDARNVLNALELAAETTEPGSEGVIHIRRDIAEESIQRRAVLYDKDGDVHYDTISAFIKSLRGSDPDAALYWMARMVYAGEDPRFIFRRMLIFVSEDIGMADPQALMVVNNCAQAFDYVGMPEGRFHLAHACIYCATAPKSNSTMAFFDALSNVEKESREKIPDHLRDPARDAEGFGHGKGYMYPHAYKDHWVAQQYLPDFLQGRLFYQPGTQGYEAQVKKRVERMRQLQLAAMQQSVQHIVPYGSDQDSEGRGAVRDEWNARVDKYEKLADVQKTLLEAADIGEKSMVAILGDQSFYLCGEALSRHPAMRILWVRETQNTVMPEDVSGEIDTKTLEMSSIPCGEWIDQLSDQIGPVDRILFHNLLRQEHDKPACIQRLCGILAPAGRLSFSQDLPGAGSRLSEFVVFSGKDKHLSDAFVKAEEDALKDPNDPVVNWTPENVTDTLKADQRLGVTSDVHEYLQNQRFSKQAVQYWFRETDSRNARTSLGQRCAQYCSREDVVRISEILCEQLVGKKIPWISKTAFLCVELR